MQECFPCNRLLINGRLTLQSSRSAAFRASTNSAASHEIVAFRSRKIRSTFVWKLSISGECAGITCCIPRMYQLSYSKSKGREALLLKRRQADVSRSLRMRHASRQRPDRSHSMCPGERKSWGRIAKRFGVLRLISKPPSNRLQSAGRGFECLSAAQYRRQSGMERRFGNHSNGVANFRR